MTKAIAYGRVSTEDQGRGWSLPTQLQAIREYAERNGLEIVAEFSDDETGTKLERTGFVQVRELLFSGGAQALIVYTQDRLSRKLTDLLMLRDELQQRGIAIHFAKQGRIVGDSAETRALDNVEAIFAEMERERILERTARGRQGKIASGRYLGGGHAPYGYRVEGQGRDTQLMIDEEQAEIVRLIFQLFAYGDDTGKLSAAEIGRRLTARGIPTPGDIKKGFGTTKKRAYGQWSPGSIYPLLRQSAYIGRFLSGRYTTTNGKRVRNRQEKVTITVPAIIDDETWNIVQQRLNEGPWMSPRRTKNDYLVARRLKCSCGYHLIGRPSVRQNYAKVYLYYICNGRPGQGNAQPCAMPPLAVPRIDDIVWQWMKEVLLNPDELEAELREQSAMQSARLAALEAERERLYQRKVEIENEIRRLVSLYTKGTIPEVLLDAEMAQKKMILETLEREISNNDRQRQTPLTEDRIAALRAFAEELQRGIDVAEQDFAARRQLVELMDVRVEMVWRGKEIWLKITSDLGEGLLRYMSRLL